jgi:hypothetical protein
VEFEAGASSCVFGLSKAGVRAADFGLIIAGNATGIALASFLLSIAAAVSFSLKVWAEAKLCKSPTSRIATSKHPKSFKR